MAVDSISGDLEEASWSNDSCVDQEGGDRGSRPPEKSRSLRLISNTGPDPLKTNLVALVQNWIMKLGS